MMSIFSSPALILKTAFVLVLFTLSWQVPVMAQIAFTNKAQLKAETRRSRREAARVEADYKESHLNTSNFTYKKGKVGRKRIEVQEGWETYQFNESENVVYPEPVTRKLKRKAGRKKK